ncbi:MAG: hypothetical protein ACYTG0_34570 [Planctomycetota bacterium]|jgi:20S proteasome alpha/beta subunit
MSLIVALQGKDGLVLAADSRGTIGDPRTLTAINDDQIKLFQLSKFCGAGISGASEFAAKVIDALKQQRRDSKTQYADEIAEETRQLVRRLYDDWFEKFKVDERPSMTFTVVGFQKDGTSMTPRTYFLTSRSDFAPHLFPTGNCLAGIPQYAVYLMHRFYDPEMTVKSLATKSAGYKKLPQNEVEEIVKKNNEQSERLKRSFFSGR